MSLFGKLFRGAAAAASVVIGVNSAAAQEPVRLPPAISDIPGLTAENPVEPAAGFGRPRATPNCPGTSPCPYPCPQGHPVPPTQPMTPGMGTPMPPNMGNPMQPTQPQAPQFDFGDLSSGADVGALVPQNGPGGYIENALPVNMARIRFDAAYGNNRPDRGNFFYAKCGCFRPQPDAIGVPLPEKNIDYQELITTGEVAFTQRMSVFADVPVRFLNPDVNQNAAGIGDIGFGGKYALIYNQKRVVSAWLRFQAPAGSISRGLGNGVWWIEPGLLYQENLNRNWQLFGELRYLTSLGDRTDFVGDLIRYGIGTSYVVMQGDWGYVAPVAELVGWTVLSGKQLDPDQLAAVGASGDTIVNAKLGLRVGFGSPRQNSPYRSRSDLYVGYGRALTGEVWYKDMIRVEFRRFF
jgi:hypothetical protein